LKYQPIWPTKGKSQELDAKDFGLRIRSDYGRLDGIRFVFLSDSHGVFRDAAGSSRSISTAEDYELLMGLRKLCDGVLTSAKTAKIEKYQASRLCSIAIVAGSTIELDIPALNQTASPNLKAVYLICHASQELEYLDASRRYGFHVLALANGAPGKLSAVDVSQCLRSLDIRHVAFEGGPSLLQSFLSAGLIEEFCMSTTFDSQTEMLDYAQTPELLLPYVDLRSSARSQGFQLYASALSDGTVFTRWRRA